MKDIPIGKKKKQAKKLFLFSSEIFVFVQSPQTQTKQLLELNQLSKCHRIEINVLFSMVALNNWKPIFFKCHIIYRKFKILI